MINPFQLDEVDLTKEALLKMGQIAENHCPDIQLHLDRIRQYTYILAINAGLSQKDAEEMAYASMLHDIGMVGMPNNIATKTGELSYEEWELIKKHPSIGSEILKNAASPILQIGEIITLTHHERWNGSGYPNGLKGENIPLGGRICGLVDVFDAITSNRAYRDRVHVETALELIKESSDLFFDPKLVEIFENHFPEIRTIGSKN